MVAEVHTIFLSFPHGVSPWGIVCRNFYPISQFLALLNEGTEHSALALQEEDLSTTSSRQRQCLVQDGAEQ
jgi:hypothetical protein